MSSVDIMTTQAVGTGVALFAALSPTMAAAAATSTTTSVEDEQTDKIIGQADQLYDSNQWKEALAYLEQYAESSNVEVLWRLARLCYKVSDIFHNKINMKPGRVRNVSKFYFGLLFRKI
jgi:hypothetical protein